ncbi:MAG: ATP-binding protein [Succinivibrionaceae bacterium]|nr:ATP-binding protein [Succinivibrionaceae bacterium]
MSEDKVELLSTPYGEVAYETFRELGRAFVDKSSVIKDLEDSKTPLYPVLLRPRRFGKSTFIQMLKCFYDISYKDRYDEIFNGKDIYTENLPSHNTYHVINFDFSRVNTQSNTAMLNSFFSAVANGIDNFKRRYPDFVFDYSELDTSDSVTLFNNFASAYSKYAKNCFTKGSIGRLYVMIDEYDNFANQILSQDVELFRTITGNNGLLKAFYASIKAAAADSDCIARTFITGVSSVSLDSLTSGFNISRNVTSRACFNEYAGFTEAELAKLVPQLIDLKQLGISADEVVARMKPVYDGYCFSQETKQTVFNSSMCLYYLDEMRIKGRFLPPEDYMDPASDHDGSKLQQLFAIAEDGLADEIIGTYLSGERFLLKELAENINLNKDAKYNRIQLLSMLYYLGYLTIDTSPAPNDKLPLKIPNLFMSKLFAQCTADMRLKPSKVFTDSILDISSLQNLDDDISTFAASCTEFLSSIFTNQVLTHMSEMALNLTLFTKLDSMRGVFVEMQKSLRLVGDGEKFADLVITVNEDKINECTYLIELKYVTKTDASDSKIQNLIKEASEQVAKYKSALEFRDRQVKAYSMIFVGSNCVHCQMQ